MPPEIKARELLTLLLDDEEYNSNRGPRSIVGFEELLEKMDKLCDAITQGKANGEGAGEYEGGGEGGHSEEMRALVENLTAMRELIGQQTGGPPPAHSEETRTLLTTIAKNTMRRERSWEFDIQRDRRTGFTEKIIAKPVGE
jgi:hypothetical protein